MATRTISTRLELTGEAEYKRTVTAINSSLKTLKSELSLVDAEFKGNANSMEALQAKGAVLQRQYAAQSSKLDTLSTALEQAHKLKAQFGTQVEQSSAKLEQARTSLEQLQKSTGDTSLQEAKLTAEIKQYEAALMAAERAQQKTGNSVNYYQQQVNSAKISLIATGEELAKNSKYQEEAATSADHCAKSIDAMGKELLTTGQAAGAAAAKLDQGIANAKDTVSATQAELEALKGKLRTGWSTESFAQAQEVARRAVEETAQQVELLKEKLGQMEGAGLQEASVGEYQRLKQALIEAEGAAADAHEQLQEVSELLLDSWQTACEDAAESLDSVGSAMSVGLTAPLAAGGAAAVHFASDTSESLNKVEVAFDDAANGVKRWASTTLTSIGLAKGTALDMAALFGDMATSMDFGTEEAAEMSRSLVDLAADLASFKNISIDEAATALKSIFTGETESLKNLGVVMTETNLKAYAMTKGMESSYESMSQAEKVTLRYQYVMEQTKNAQGDFARTFDGTANQMRVCQESLKELAATAGEDLLPIITPIIAKVNELLQAFTEMDESTRGAVMGALLFTATLGPMLKVSGAMAAGVSKAIGLYPTLNALLTVHRARNTEAAVSQEVLNLAQAANPAGMLITAIGALTAIVASFAITAALTAEKTESLNDKLRETKKAYEETAAALAENKADTLDMVAALEGLVETEHKTVAQKETLLSLVGQLNEAVPELSLAYDTQTESLNLTTEAIRDMALAQAEQEEAAGRVVRLSALYVEQEMLVGELAAAEDALSAAEAQKNQMWEEGAYSSMAQEGAVKAASKAFLEAQKAIEELSAALVENQAETAALERAHRGGKAAMEESATAAGKHSAAMTLTSQALYGAAEDAAALEQRLEELRDTTAEQTKATQGLLDETELLSKAFAQQDKDGSLALDTALKLIDAGYASALVVDTETNAVGLNAAEYQRLAGNKLEEQIVALKTQQTSVNSSIQQRQEAAAARENAASYLGLAKARLEEQKANGKNSDASLAELEAQAKSLDAQIAVLQGLQQNMGQVTSGSYGGSGGSSSKRSAKSAADKMVEAYKEAVEELDYLRDMDEISEEEYYQRLEGLRDKYLKADSDAWRSATVKLHDWRKSREEALSQAMEERYNERMAELKYYLNMGLIAEEEYYREMAKLRDAYLTEDSAAWRQANEALYAYQQQQMKEQLDAMKEQLEAQKDAIEDWYDTAQDALEERYDGQKEAAKSAYDAEKQALKEAYDAEKKAAKEAYEAKKAQIKEALALEKERLNEVIAGIDREIQARRELRQDEGQEDAIAKAQKRLDAAKAQLAFARTDEDKHQWSQEIVRLEKALADAIQDKEDTAFYREKELEKEQVKEQITAAEEAADKELTAAETAYQSKVTALEADYAAKTAALEAAYQEKLAALEADYQDSLAALAREHERRNAEAEEAFRKAAQEIEESRRNNASAGGSGGGITTEDILNAGPGGYGPDGLHFKDGYNPYAGAAKAAGAALAGAMGAAVGAVSNTLNSVTKHNTASVTIHQAPSLTEGQISGAVQKALERLAR